MAYGTDIEALMPQLVAAVAPVRRVLGEPNPPAVRLTAFAADGLELTVFFWIADPDNGQANVRSDVNLAILRTLDRLGVEIPYPQRVVRALAPLAAPAAPVAPVAPVAAASGPAAGC